MKKTLLTIVLTFALGAAFGAHAAKKGGVDSSAWQGLAPKDAAARLLALGEGFAGDGSWETIHVGRVYYLSGDKEKGEALFDRVRQQKKVDAGDLVRIARVYAQADEWDKAALVYEEVLRLEPEDADWLAEAGAFYNLNGDRARAEALFERSFAQAPDDLDNTLDAAGSYVGVAPRKL